jgi:hypothetical protein
MVRPEEENAMNLFYDSKMDDAKRREVLSLCRLSLARSVGFQAV